MTDKIVLPDDPKKALLDIAGYLSSVHVGKYHEVKNPETGEIDGYWQTAEYLEGCLEIEQECRRITSEPSDKLSEFQGINLTADRPQVITFCGSSRFVSLMAVMMWEFEKKGCISMGLHLLPYEYCEKKGYIPDESGHIHHIGEQEGIEDAMDALHFKKIEMSDSIYVVNYQGYIGSSTKREIEYAEYLGKPVIYHEQINPSSDGK